uniref:Prenyl transferase n=1 Tax=Callithamnion tetricum TaxID=193179 RepID=A0A4D6WMI9_9FLOR|nr:Prenyl transferase [Callithamnion tetricum]
MKISDNIFALVKQDLLQLDQNLHKMIVAEHPILYAAAEHLFNAGGKRIRPAIIFLVAQATVSSNTILNEHKRLAEITEIIHTASLVHDDVIDECQMRRGLNTVHNEFSTKIAVLAGDYLFAQSSWYLANLNNVEVVKTISKVITDFAEGEVRQGLTNFDYTISIDSYIEKSFYKTASLIAASCTGTAMLSNIKQNQQQIFYLYGKHIGLAFQIIDDILDIISSTRQLGKPSGLDLKNGNLTAPVLFALEENPMIYKFISREFRKKNDIKHTIYLIKKTNGIQKAKDLAQEHIQLALKVLKKLNSNNNSIQTLILISHYITNRIN